MFMIALNVFWQLSSRFRLRVDWVEAGGGLEMIFNSWWRHIFRWEGDVILELVKLGDDIDFGFWVKFLGSVEGIASEEWILSSSKLNWGHMEILEYLTLKLQRYILSVPLLQLKIVCFFIQRERRLQRDDFFQKKEAKTWRKSFLR